MNNYPQTKISSVILLLLFLMAGVSCQKMFLLSKGIRNPTLQTEKSVNHYLVKKKMNHVDGSFILRDSISLMELIRYVKSFPSVSFFTPQGELIIINDSGFCAGVAYNYASDLQPGASCRIDTTFFLTKLNPLITSLSTADEILTGGPVDVILVGFWATYFGSVNNNVFGVLEAIRNNPAINSRIYLINTDFLESWQMKSEPGIKFL